MTGADEQPDMECTRHDPEAMFPASEDPIVTASGRKIDNPDVAAAKAICFACSSRAECLEGALRRREEYGVWGGTTGRERQAIRRRHYRHVARQEEMLEVSA